MNRIRTLREERGWTQTDLGKLLNVKDSAVSKYESGKVPLTGETLKRLSEIFEVSVDYILGLSPIRNVRGSSYAKPDIASIDVDILKAMERLSPDSKKKLKDYVEMLKELDEVKHSKNCKDFSKKA